ncbi:MAG TPA: EcsC family protein [Pirellulales bacterium]|nr:EcsC family protein [Pirellulales bacterium]
MTDYEARVVREVALWKGRKRNERLNALGRLTRPLSAFAMGMVPKQAVHRALATAFTTSTWLSGPAGVVRMAGVETLDELRYQSLKLSDSVARRVGKRIRAAAALGGAVTGSAGWLFAVADISTLVVLSMRAVHRTGLCYGYALDRPEEQAYLMAVLTLSTTTSPPRRLELIGQLHDARHWWLSQAVDSLAQEAIVKRIIRLASLEAVPGIGSFVGSAANVKFVGDVLTTSRRIFQERWLRDNGKVDQIPPAASYRPNRGH